MTPVRHRSHPDSDLRHPSLSPCTPPSPRGWKTGKEAAMCDLDDLGSSKTALNNLEQYLIFVLKASMGQGVIMPLRCLVKGE